MTEKLHNQVNGTEWSWKNLNTVSSLCLDESFILKMLTLLHVRCCTACTEDYSNKLVYLTILYH